MKHLKNIFKKALPLSFGLALSIVMIGKICFDLSYDNFYNDVDRIYAIRTGYSEHGGSIEEYSNISGAVAPGFKQYVPGVEEATRGTFLVDSDKYLTSDKTTISADGELMIADTCFFKIFNREILIGDPEEILDTWGQVMISRSFAEKMGGVQEAVGKTFSSYDIPGLEFTVAGVFEDFPKNGTLHFDILVPMCMYGKSSTENWIGNDRYHGYVKLQEGVDPSSLTDAIRLMQEKNQPLDELEKSGLKLWYFLEPFDKLHTSDKDVRNSIILLTIIAVLLMAISILNYLLSTVSEVVERSKSFATRKCFGATGKNIYTVLLREAAITIAVALAIAVLILLAGSDFIRNIMGVSMEDMLVPATWGAVAGILIVILAFTALIPGYIYMKVPVTAALRRFSDTKKTWKYILLVSQFTINVFLFGMLFVMAEQYDKVLSDDTGYNYENILYFSTTGNNPEKVNACVERISSIAGVREVQRSSVLPFDPSSGNNIFLPGDDRQLFNVADQYFGTQGFFEFFEIPIIEGREPITANEVAVSRSFVEKMQEFADWSDGAVGKQILVSEHSQSNEPDQILTVSGVYEDYLIGTFNNCDERPSIRFSSVIGHEWNYLNNTLVKVDKISPELISAIENTIDESLATDMKIEVLSYEDTMKNLYSGNKKMRDTFLLGGFFALFISVFGLIGYIANESARRSKEIAVRKINGAKASDIVGMFVLDSLKMSAIAIVIGDILLFLAASRYLQQFSERIDLHAGYYLAADLLLILIVVATVVANSVKIANSNPVESIKNE